MDVALQNNTTTVGVILYHDHVTKTMQELLQLPILTTTPYPWMGIDPPKTTCIVLLYTASLQWQQDSNPEEAKIQLKTVLVYCEQLLLENNKIVTEPSAVIKEEHMKIGEKLYSTIMETLAENIIVIEDDLILFEEADEEGLLEEVEDSGLQSDDDTIQMKKGRKLIRMTFRLIIK
ncbi:hypothetical protein TNCV_5062081 [Trichonephila clavipes]|nr:hypothetical protein TNCV_5062081 [Trichonephila clavipes]